MKFTFNRNSRPESSVKKVLFKISPNSLENNCDVVSLLIKLQTGGKLFWEHQFRRVTAGRCFSLKQLNLASDTLNEKFPIIKQLKNFLKLIVI